MLVSPQQLVIWFTKWEVLTPELFKSLKKKLMKKDKELPSMLGYLIKLNNLEKVVKPSIVVLLSSRLNRPIFRLLMLQDTEISSKI